MIPWDPSFTGGVSQVVINVAETLRTHGAYNPVVIVEEWPAVYPRKEIRNGVNYVFIRLRPPLYGRVPLWRRIPVQGLHNDFAGASFPDSQIAKIRLGISIFRPHFLR
jgi:hypothetical protein